jgi:hypothetical protein
MSCRSVISAGTAEMRRDALASVASSSAAERNCGRCVRMQFLPCLLIVKARKAVPCSRFDQALGGSATSGACLWDSGTVR